MDLQSVDKTWVEDPPSRLPYDSLHLQPDTEEENTDKFFIALTVIFLLGLCYTGSHMWRTHKAYKIRLEKETDENIMRNKEKATKLQEPSVSFLQLNKDEENKDGDMKANGVVIDIIPTIIVEANEDKPPSRRGSLRFRDMVDKDIAWEPLEEKDEILENEEEEDEAEEEEAEEESASDDATEDENDTDNGDKNTTLQNGQASDTEQIPRKLSIQLPYKVDEENTIELTSSA